MCETPFLHMGFSNGSASKESTGNARDTGDMGSILQRRKWLPTLVFLPRKSHEQGSLESYSPLGCKESDTTEWLSMNERILNRELTLKSHQELRESI